MNREKLEKSNSNKRRQLIRKLKKDKENIDVEIKNISVMRCLYKNNNDFVYFDLQPGESTMIGLDDIYEIAHKCKGFFKNYEIIITDVYSDDYTLDDILLYLNLQNIYENIPNKDEDCIEELVYEADIDDFKNQLEDNRELCKAVAQEMLVAFKSEDYYDKKKIQYICEKLKIRDLFAE